jgi:fumarylpyruvate hydrolase
VIEYVFAAPAPPSVTVVNSPARFPVHRIYCVGRNYAEHAREMGSDPARESPVFFQKPVDAIVESGQAVRYPPRTQNFHHEVELVVALGAGGSGIATTHALSHVFGYAVGNDFTRRDLQLQSKKGGNPWDTSKGFDHSAGIAAIHRAHDVGHLTAGRIWLTVNDQLRQQADLQDLIWSVPEIIAELSSYFELQPGDLIYTGTPAGVGPLLRGDRIECGIDALGTLRNTIT